jgi:hypothetical protein
MAKDPNIPETNPWLVPFEAGRQWMELAAKAQTVLSQQLKQDKIPAPFSQEVVAGAFSQLFAGLLSDPAKMARAQQDLWQRHAALWQDLIVFARGDPGVQAGEEARPFVACGRIRR